MRCVSRVVAVLCLVPLGAAIGAQSPAPTSAPPPAVVERVWHLGRVTGDLGRIIAFYHDHLGLNLRGAREQAFPFSSVATINEFVNAPPQAEFRASFMPIHGTSAVTEGPDQIYFEAFEYRNIDRRQVIPPLVSPGVSTLKFLVRDMAKALAAVKGAGVAVVTPGGEARPVPTPAGLSGSARAILVRDPDGYPVELVEVTPTPRTTAPDTSNILGVHMSIVVDDAEVSLDFYKRFIGADLRAWEPGAWRMDAGFSQIRDIPATPYRTASVQLPGSAIVLELIEFRDVEQTPYRPVFQDIGPGHVAFVVNDIETVLERMTALGVKPLSQSGTWTQINKSIRAVYTRDPDGFFLEIIERR